jgi:aconitate hydratase
VQRSLAGPSRPHDRINLSEAHGAFKGICESRNLSLQDTVEVEIAGQKHNLTHGALAIAAVTSCTTATDASMMLAAGILARNAVNNGLKPKPWVKCILAPGSRATEDILTEAGLVPSLQELGFYTCGFGCMSCIGNSGPVYPQMHEIADKIELASILSGNRNFDGRISPDVSQNYLCAPALVIAYSLVGTMDFDFETMPLGVNQEGKEVFLSDIWPDSNEVSSLLATCCTKQTFDASASELFTGDERWQSLGKEASDTFSWDSDSTYVRRAPYFDGMTKQPIPPVQIKGARALLNLGDFITTDHISPAGAIADNSPAARYLEEHGVTPANFNTYGARRGNHEVMMRGTFANVKLMNKLAEGKKGGWTKDFLGNEVVAVWDAAENYQNNNIPLVVLAGKMYGSGSSRDWAAKGPMLQGVRAAFAESFERIHRSNLIGMGILPLQFEDGQSVESLGLDGSETFTIGEIDFSQGLPNPSVVNVEAQKESGEKITFNAVVRIDTPTEGDYYFNGGILQYVLRSLA